MGSGDRSKTLSVILCPVTNKTPMAADLAATAVAYSASASACWAVSFEFFGNFLGSGFGFAG